ncbi:prephenate dehydrogenase/arogenate dehydrogenase family protein [Candidatus Poribacteria bacterium]|nr:prephenate dehydrogenase/arogenate dehydrogenase family protein [Candidatus Poribacteria bacterium]
MIDDFSQIRKITILGVGLIGGSLGLALKAKGFQGEITGLGRRMSTLEVALERRAIDYATTDFEAGIRDADLVVIGTPVDLIPAMVQRVGEVRAPDSTPLLMTDVGSVKGQIVEEIERLLIPRNPHQNLHFVGSHPMAGSEKTGVEAARADLFAGARCIVTPTDKTHPLALRVVMALWRFVGAKLYLLSPAQHDALIAGASHLPHLIASVLTHTVGQIESAGSPEIWTGIFMQNAPALLPLIDTMIENLTQFGTLLENRDSDGIARVLMHSKILRDSLEPG